jgi:hypothetical protein
MVRVHTLFGFHPFLRHLLNGFLGPPPLHLRREQTPQLARSQRYRCHHHPKFQGKGDRTLQPLKQLHMQQELIGGQPNDTIGNVSQFFATYPDKDCILFLEGLVPGEGFHHLLMYSLLAVFSLGSR